MKSSWKVGTLCGVAIRLHITFPLLLLWVAALEYAEGGDVRRMATGVGFTGAVFGLVVLHEMGHALMARRLGVRTRDITLLPLGGVARMERAPRTAADELWIALAGPAVNAVLAAGLFLLRAAVQPPVDADVRLVEEGLVGRLAWANVMLAAFNLLPAFPMDGGRVLRAVLALRIDPLRATEVAVVVGKGLAVLLGIIGVAINPLLAMIAVFVWFGAEQEADAARLRFVLEGVPIEAVMMTEFHVLAPDDTLERAVRLAIAGGQQHFPVVAAGAIVGMLAWPDLLAGLAESGGAAPVGEKMRAPPGVLHPAEGVERVLERERGERLRARPVVRDGRIVGLFTAENLADSVLLRSAAEHAGRRRTAFPRGVMAGPGGQTVTGGD